MVVNVVCPNCGQTTEWDENDEPLERCEDCGYELSIETFEGRAWKLNVYLEECEVLK